jgi:hypothetical protein
MERQYRSFSVSRRESRRPNVAEPSLVRETCLQNGKQYRRGSRQSRGTYHLA